MLRPKKYFFSFSVFKRSLMLCCSIQISDVQWLLRTFCTQCCCSLHLYLKYFGGHVIQFVETSQRTL